LFIERNAYAAATFYVVVSVLASVGGLLVGLIVVRKLV
jgi:hypothetical protein